MTSHYPRLRLHPTNCPELGEILVDSCLFPVGRQELPFSLCKSEAVNKLSRRHARIFQENNQFYLVDLGSMNGTKRNGEVVKDQPVLLEHQDEVNFAGICCEVVVEHDEALEQTEVIESDPVQVTLIPSAQSGGDPIVINRFPFLISKSTGVFRQYKERFDTQLQYISRRHAHIYLKDGRVFVEDLGSTNGTFVCGERLDEHAHELLDNDVVAFGPEACAFRVRVREQAVPGTGPDSEATEQIGGKALVGAGEDDLAEQGTILVDKASPFLDIFYDDVCETGTADEGESGDVQQAPTEGSPKSGKPTGGWLNKVWVFWSELKRVFAEEREDKRSRKALWVGVLLLFGAGFIFYQYGAAEKELRTLVEQGEYEAAAKLANQLLQEGESSEKVRQLSNQALLNYTMPDWINAIEQHDFDRALTTSDRSLSLASANPEARELFEVVDWMTALEKYTSGLEIDQPLVVYKNENELKALTEQWQNNASEYRRRLGVILREVPGFKDVHVKVLSDLRLLQNYSSVYLTAIDGLKTNINTYLAQGQTDELREGLIRFQNKYPKVGGIDKLVDDLGTYLDLQRNLDQKQLMPLLREVQSLQLYTPPFERLVAQKILSALPPADMAARYIESEDAWKEGQAEQAIEILESLSSESWGEIAVATIERYQRTYREFEVFGQTAESVDYDTRLVRFYNALDPEIDIYYRAELQNAFLKAKGQVQSQADTRFREAEQHWLNYRALGGITGLLRLEERVSERYRQRASLLTNAQSKAMQGGEGYQLLRLTLPPSWEKLKTNIQNELRRQRNWLLDLQKVLPPDLVESKLGLLTVEDESATL